MKTNAYRKRGMVEAVKMDLEMLPLRYEKWGGWQVAEPGDWIVLSNGDTYTINAAEFAKTYVSMGVPGHYKKSAITYARELTGAGTIKTLEGTSDYAVGDFLCAPDKEMTNAYPVDRETFLSTYDRL